MAHYTSRLTRWAKVCNRLINAMYLHTHLYYSHKVHTITICPWFTNTITFLQDYKSPFTSVITSADKARFNTSAVTTTTPTEKSVMTSPSPPMGAEESKAWSGLCKATYTKHGGHSNNLSRVITSIYHVHQQINSQFLCEGKVSLICMQS